MYVGCSDLQHALCDPSRPQRSLAGGGWAKRREGKKKDLEEIVVLCLFNSLLLYCTAE